VTQRATESITVHASPETIYAVVTDFERYADWVSDLKRIEVVTRDDQGRGLEVEFRAAAFGRSTTYTLRYDYAKAPGVLSWRQVQGDLTETLNGRYTFDADADGDETRVTYDLEVELLVPIPTFIKSRAAYRIQTQALRELKAQAERRR
jgi:ribosome-associated toxin RatA of RatAB toxin-antitoxin module